MTFKVYGAWWNGKAYDCVCKEADTINAAIGAASLLLRECSPKQIWIIDLDNKSPIPDEFGAVASSLNKMEDLDCSTQMTLEVCE